MALRFARRCALVALMIGPAACVRTGAPGPKTAAAPDDLVARADRAFEQQQWPLAAELYRDEVARHPNDAHALCGEAAAELGQDHPQAAIPLFERSVSLEENKRCRYNLGLALAMTGKVAEALPQFRRAVEIDPRYGLGWLAVARASAQLGNLPDAAAAILKAHELLPNDPEVDALAAQIAQVLRPNLPPEALAHHARGGELLAAGDADGAEREYRAALAIAPDFADCHYNLGLIASHRGDLAGAEREYRAAIAGYPPEGRLLRADAQNNLADLLVRRGESASEAVALVREAIGVRGERPSYLDTLARACDAGGDRACAQKSFTQLLAAPDLPPDVRAHAEERLRALSH